MKRIFLVIAIVAIAVSACKKDPAIHAKKTTTSGPSLSYNDSYSTWVAYKKTIHNSYSYTTTFGSFSGYTAEIKTSVSNGVIMSRDFTAFQYEQNSNNKTITDQWHEDKNTLGTHENAGEALTLDDIYMKAKNVWLKVDPKSNDIYFETQNNGLISSCGYVPMGCQDDCFTGVHIASITSL